MDNYIKGETKEIECEPPFASDLIHNVSAVMKIKPGTKLRSINGFVDKTMKIDANRKILFSGYGKACAKTVSCVELYKRQAKFPLHQLTRIAFRRIEEYWEPQIDGIDRLKVNRDIPATFILLSKDQLDQSLPGYQDPNNSLPSFMSSPDQQIHSKAKSKSSSASSMHNKWKRKEKRKRGQKEQTSEVSEK